MFTYEGLSFRLILLPFLIVVITIHEFAHAFVASKLGDETAKMSGRLTLNPLAHLDLMGTLALVFFGIGWGKPVPFNPYNLKNVKRDQALIAFAGPASNIALAVFLAVLYRFIGSISLIGSILSALISLSLVLAVFNLLPIGPLDGFRVVLGLLPNKLVPDWLETERDGILILVFLIVSGLLGRVISVPSNLILKAILP